jgi:hypothetical protein
LVLPKLVLFFQTFLERLVPLDLLGVVLVVARVLEDQLELRDLLHLAVEAVMRRVAMEMEGL